MTDAPVATEPATERPLPQDCRLPTESERVAILVRVEERGDAALGTRIHELLEKGLVLIDEREIEPQIYIPDADDDRQRRKAFNLGRPSGMCMPQAILDMAMAAAYGMQSRGRPHREVLPEIADPDQLMGESRTKHDPDAAAKIRAERLARKAANRLKREAR